jgi:hypothetical protein
MKVNGDLEIVSIPESAGAFLYCCNFRIQTFRHSVGNAMSEVRQDVGQMSGEQLGLVNHGRQPTVRGPKIPAIPESLRPSSTRVSPQFAQRFFQRPSPGRLQVVMLDLVKSLPGSSRHGVGVVQPKVFAGGERMVAFLKQYLVFLFAHGIHAIAHMLHDVEAIKYHLLLRLRHMRPTGFDVCRPHVQTDRFDLLQLLWREGGKVGAQARLSSLFANIFHGHRLQIAHQGHVMRLNIRCAVAIANSTAFSCLRS